MTFILDIILIIVAILIGVFIEKPIEYLFEVRVKQFQNSVKRLFDTK